MKTQLLNKAFLVILLQAGIALPLSALQEVTLATGKTQKEAGDKDGDFYAVNKAEAYASAIPIFRTGDGSTESYLSRLTGSGSGTILGIDFKAWRIYAYASSSRTNTHGDVENKDSQILVEAQINGTTIPGGFFFEDTPGAYSVTIPTTMAVSLIGTKSYGPYTLQAEVTSTVSGTVVLASREQATLIGQSVLVGSCEGWVSLLDTWLPFRQILNYGTQTIARTHIAANASPSASTRAEVLSTAAGRDQRFAMRLFLQLGSQPPLVDAFALPSIEYIDGLDSDAGPSDDDESSN